MIKSTFLNLSESKKQRVISAIIDEFAREDTNRVSINNIIEQANISRGSFYQYFDDKMDLVEVVFHYYAEQCVSEISKVIDISRGDIFYTYEECFSIMAELGARCSPDCTIPAALFRNLSASAIRDLMRSMA